MNKQNIRAPWGLIKSSAESHGPTLLEGLASIALNHWAQSDAGTKLSADRSTREAFVASLIGAVVVDNTIDKLANDGVYTALEAEFLRDLNAEAALTDLTHFQKSAGTFNSIMDVLKKQPTLAGATVGGLAGGAFGAYADDENRLRGALRFGIPGAATGALVGHGAGQLKRELRDTNGLHRSAEEIARDIELHNAKLKLIQAQTEAAKLPRG